MAETPEAESTPPDPSPTPAEPELPDDPTELMRATLGGNLAAILRKMVDSGDKSFIPVLIEFLRFQIRDEPRVSIASYINKILEGSEVLTIPPERTRWDWWIEWLGNLRRFRHPRDMRDGRDNCTRVLTRDWVRSYTMA